MAGLSAAAFGGEVRGEAKSQANFTCTIIRYLMRIGCYSTIISDCLLASPRNLESVPHHASVFC